MRATGDRTGTGPEGGRSAWSDASYGTWKGPRFSLAKYLCMIALLFTAVVLYVFFFFFFVFCYSFALCCVFILFARLSNVKQINVVLVL